jgi:D-aspartate ligase
MRKAVVLGLSTPGATILRNLSSRGYGVWGITDDAAEEGLYSRHGRKMISPNPSTDLPGWLSFMKELAKKIQDRAVLIPTGDKYVMAIEKGIEELLPYYRTHQNEEALHTKLISKVEQVRMAKKEGFAVPESKEVSNSDEVVSFYNRIGGPILLKPEFSYFWHGSRASQALNGAKILVAHSKSEARNIFELARAHSDRLLAQELIPGEDSNLFYWTGIVGKDRAGGRLIGRKIRVLPPGKGSASFVQLANIPEIDAQCLEFLKKIGFRGICGIEVKYDKRDGKFKLIETNPRYGLWDDIGVPLGINLAREAVDELYGDPLEAKTPKSFRQKWVAIHRDLVAYAGYWRESRLSVFSWLYTLRGPIIVNDFPFITDAPYAVHNLWAFAIRFINKMRPRGPIKANFGGTYGWKTTL